MTYCLLPLVLVLADGGWAAGTKKLHQGMQRFLW